MYTGNGGGDCQVEILIRSMKFWRKWMKKHVNQYFMINIFEISGSKLLEIER